MLKLFAVHGLFRRDRLREPASWRHHKAYYYAEGGPQQEPVSPTSRIRLPTCQFCTMATRKHLKLADNICQAGAKTAVVKTYPVPNAVVSEIDSSDYVSAPDQAEEGRQDAPLLERC
jgi:hypothetical protein